MVNKGISFLLGAAALGLAASVQPARAGGSDTHVLTLRLPDGATEQIRYSGDTPPEIALLPPKAAPILSMDRMMATMEQQVDALMRMPLFDPDRITQAALGDTDGSVCMRSMSITYSGNGAKPSVVSHVSGDCGDTPAARAPERAPQAQTIAWEN